MGGHIEVYEGVRKIWGGGGCHIEKYTGESKGVREVNDMGDHKDM